MPLTGRAALCLVCLVAAIIGSSAHPGIAADLSPVSADGPRQSLSGRMDVLEDKSGMLGVADVAALPYASLFRPLPHYLAAGFSPAAFWLRFSLRRRAAGSGRRLLEVDMPYLQHVDLYLPNGAGGFTAVKTGARLPFATRPIAYRNFVFPLVLPADQPQTFYLRVQTVSTVVAKVTLWKEDSFIRSASAIDALLGCINGVVLVTIFASFMLYMTSRESVYLHYTLYILFFEVTFAGIDGYIAQFLFPTMPAVSDVLVRLGACLTIAAGALLCSPILDLKDRHPRLHRIYRTLGFAAYAATPAVFFNVYSLVAVLLHLVVIYICTVQMIVAARMALRGESAGLSYLAAFGVQISAFNLLALRNMGVIGGFEGVDMLVQIGGVLHIILLSVGLAQRVAATARDKRSAQATLLAMSQQQERLLERHVAERTAELSAANRRLATEVAERQAGEAHLRALLDAAPFPMLVVSMMEGRLLFLNGPAGDLLGLPPDSGLGRSAMDFYATPEDRTSVVARLADEGVIGGAEIQLRRANGELCWTLLSAVRFRYGAEDAVMVCANDISARKDLERTLVDARERSDAALAAQQRAMREQRNFLAMVSHEFRTPLSVVGAAADVLGLSRDIERDRRAGELAKIRRAVQRMTALIDSYLADEWLDADVDSLRIRHVDLGALLLEMRDDYGSIAAQPVRVTLPTGMTDMEGDPDLLRVLLSNLVDNAMKYSPSTGEIRIGLAVSEADAVIAVSDDGPGIAEVDQANLFDKFYRGRSATGRNGTGLGLHLARRIAERHRGVVAVTSAAGAGTTFTVRLPRRQATSPHQDQRMARDDVISQCDRR